MRSLLFREQPDRYIQIYDISNGQRPVRCSDIEQYVLLGLNPGDEAQDYDPSVDAPLTNYPYNLVRVSVPGREQFGIVYPDTAYIVAVPSEDFYNGLRWTLEHFGISPDEYLFEFNT